MPKSRKRQKSKPSRSKRRRVNPLELDGLFDILVNTSYRPKGPKILYHYTSWGAAKGILCGQHFWETAHNCTNDEAEIRSAHSVIVDVAKLLRSTAIGSAAAVFDLFIDSYPRLQLDKLKTVYLSCFSLARDDERQWEKYGDNGRGLCLGLRILDERSPNPKDRASALIQVDYSEESWRKHLTENFDKISALLSRAVNSRRTTELGVSALYRIAAFASIMAKQPQWALEKEVRHVTFLRNGAKVKPQERQASGQVIRYLDDVELRTDCKLVAFAEVILGPNQSFSEGQSRLAALLAECGYQTEMAEYPAIEASQVRPWKDLAHSELREISFGSPGIIAHE